MESSVDTAVSSIPCISPQDLATRIGRRDTPLLIDVRRQARFDESPVMLAGAMRCAPENVAALAAAGPAREAIVYCVYGHNVSQDAVTALNDAGWRASALSGGIEGGQDGVDAPADTSAWRATRPPVIRKRGDLGVTGESPSRWVTRERPKIDRIACPWLVRRFIDPRAEFFYVPTDRVFDEAKRLGAVAFDIAGASITHAWEKCSFDALLSAFELRTPALDALAKIVRAADTARLDLAPQAPGLLAVSLGLSLLHADDHAMLEAAMPIYDALYAWCRDGQDERHNWPAHFVTVTPL
jgi:rhodanese-related sulfurtransferase